MDFQSLDININQDILNVLLACLAVLVLVLIIKLINKGFERLIKTVFSWRGTKIKGVVFHGYNLLTVDYTVKIIVAVLKIIKTALLIFLVYSWLPLLFSIFPWTESIADQLLEWIVYPVKTLGGAVLDYLPSLFFVVVIVYLVRKAMRVLNYFSNEVESGKLKLPGFYSEWAKPTYNIVRFTVWVFTFVIIFPYLPGANSPAFQGVSIFLGILLSLGSTSIVANAVGGLMIIYMRPFIIGDVIKIGDTTGKVVGKNLLVTRVCTSKNEDITIPNKTIIESEVTNFSSDARSKGVFIHTQVTLGYDVSWRKIHELMISAANKTNGVLPEPKPYVLQTALNDFNVSYEINAYTDNPEGIPRIYSELYQHLMDEFNEAEIEILSPFYHATRDGNASTIYKANT